MKINSQKGFIVGGVVALVAIVLVAGGVYYIGAYKTSDNTIQDTTPYIDTVSIIDTPIENGLTLTGKNFSANQSVYINVSSNAAANFFPTDLNKIVVSENGTKLQIKSLNLVKGKTYIVRVINNVDSFLFNGAVENDSNEISITVPSNNKVGDTSSTSDWKTFMNESFCYNVKYPSTYHPAYDTNLVNFDEDKFERGNPDGVKIQFAKNIAKFDASEMNTQITKTMSTGEARKTLIELYAHNVFIYHNKVTSGPGGAFDIYYFPLSNKSEYYTAFVWGRENDPIIVDKILNTFEPKCGISPSNK